MKFKKKMKKNFDSFLFIEIKLIIKLSGNKFYFIKLFNKKFPANKTFNMSNHDILRMLSTLHKILFAIYFKIAHEYINAQHSQNIT